LFDITFVSHITKLKTTGTLSLLAAYQLFSKPIVLLRLSLEKTQARHPIKSGVIPGSACKLLKVSKSGFLMHICKIRIKNTQIV
jgi:hypothetical protein